MLRLWLCVVLFALCNTAAQAAPVEAYGALPAAVDMSISPDGKRLAFMSARGGEQRVMLVDIASGAPIGSAVSGPHKVRGIMWAGNDHLVVTTSTTAGVRGLSVGVDERLQAVILQVPSLRVRPLAQEGAVRGVPLVLGRPVVRRVSGETFVYFQSVQVVGQFALRSLLRTNVATGRTTVVETGQPTTRDWMVGSDGVVIARLEGQGDSGAVRLLAGRGLLTDAGAPEDYRGIRLAGLGRDGQSVLVRVQRADDIRFAEFSLQTRTWTEVSWLSEPDEIVFDPVTHTMIGQGAMSGDHFDYTFIHLADQVLWQPVAEALDEDYARIASWSDDRRRIVLRIESSGEPPVFVMIDAADKSAKIIGPVYADLDADDVAPVRSIAYPAADGMAITGFLTLPKVIAAERLPLIVLVHGGPASRDVPGFNWWAQAMASRGYAVLQANFRGSSGFGLPFMRAGFGEFGRKMQTDLSDGVRYLGASGIVDPSRVCIVGASYGGYAALVGATQQSEIYRCAASVSGPSDLRRQLGASRARGGISSLRYWLQFIGADNLRDPVIAEISPAVHADKAAIPILLVHGRDDVVVPFEQSQIMADALRDAGRPYELVALAGEDHWLSGAETRQQMLVSVMRFLEQQNPPGRGH